MEVAGGKKSAAYASLVRAQKGLRQVVSDDDESIKATVFGQLPVAEWQRRVEHFERNVLS